MSNFEVFWPGWETVEKIGSGSYGYVYKIERELFGIKEVAALKVITIPKDTSAVETMRMEGYDSDSIVETIKDQVNRVLKEYETLKVLSGNTNIVDCDELILKEHSDGLGYDIFMKMELLTPLMASIAADEFFTEEQVIKLGQDICRALVTCKKLNIIHRDIKPENIMISRFGDYKLGDFGIAKTIEKTTGGTKAGTNKFIAPEVYKSQPYGSRVDIYSLGLVLYWMLNKKRVPFMPLPPNKIKAGMADEAFGRRIDGEELPPPADGCYSLKKIVLKACAYKPEDRYDSAEAMLEDLLKLTNKYGSFELELQEPGKVLAEEFKDNEDLINVVVPEGVTEIGNKAFSNCLNLRTLTLPDTLTTIGSKAFENCSELKNATIPTSVVTIGDSAFANCKNLKVLIENNDANIAKNAFTKCKLVTRWVNNDLHVKKLNEYDSKLSKSNAALEEAKAKNKELEQTSKKLNTTISKYEKDNTKLVSDTNSKIAAYEKKINQLTEDSQAADAKLEATNEVYKSMIDELNVKLSEREAEYNKLKKDISSKEKTINNLKAKHITETEDLKKKLGESEVETLDMLQKLNAAKSDYEAEKKKSEALKSELDDAKNPKFKTALKDQIKPFEFAGRNDLVEVIVPDGITKIGKYAFKECNKLKNVILPDSVKVIENDAFSGCISLEKIRLPETMNEIGVGAFWSCEKLNNVVYPKGITSVANHVFCGCKSLNHWKCLDKLISVGEFAFWGCAFKDFNLISTTSIGMNAFYGNKQLEKVTIKGAITNLSESVFEDCSSLKEVLLPESLESIGECAFKNCTSLVNVVIPSKVDVIKKDAFSGCKALETIKLPETMKELGASVFWDCAKLNNVVFPKGITSVPKYMFCGCSSLSSMKFNGRLDAVYEYAFWGCNFGNFNLGTAKSIGHSAFSECKKLSKIVMDHTTITNLSYSAFENCTSLKEVYLPESLETIEMGAFKNCTSLSNISLPSKVKEIRKNAFEGCSLLKTLELPEGLHASGNYSLPNSIKVEKKGSLNNKAVEGEILSISNRMGKFIMPGEFKNRSFTKKTIIIPDGVVEINGSAFEGIKNVDVVIIPDSVTTIHKNAFKNSSVTEIKLPSKLVKISESAFEGCVNLKNVTIPDSVIEIESRAFIGCRNLNVAIPSSVKTIGKEAFRDSGFHTTSLTRGIVSIGELAFADCKILRELTFPYTVTSVGKDAFKGCINMHTVHVLNTLKVKGLGWSAFDPKTKIVIIK